MEVRTSQVSSFELPLAPWISQGSDDDMQALGM